VSTALEKLKQAIEEQQKLNSLFTKVIARFLFLPSNPEMGTIYNREQCDLSSYNSLSIVALQIGKNANPKKGYSLCHTQSSP
jgi:ferritin-like metal-binding protein YciE